MERNNPLRFSWPIKPHGEPDAALLRPGGSLTEGAPPLSFPPGVYDFRTPILVLALEPVISGQDFSDALLAALAAEDSHLTAYEAGVSVGPPSFMHVPNENIPTLMEAAFGIAALGATMQMTGNGTAYITRTIVVAEGDFAGTAVLTGSYPAGLYVLAAAFGVVLGAAVGEGLRRATDADKVVARWVTVGGKIGSDRTLFLNQINTAIANAITRTMRFRSPGGDRLIPMPPDSVIARLRDGGSCSGARLYTKVIAAACTRMEPTSWRPPSAPPPRAGTTPAPTPPPRVISVPHEPPVAWEGAGPRPTVPPEILAPHEPPRETLASRAKRWAKPALVVVTATAAVGLAWSLLRPRAESTPAGLPGDAPDQTRENPSQPDTFKRDFLAKLDREDLRRALRLLRRQDARPHEVNPAAAQYDGLATAASVRAEYKRRGWKIPAPTRYEQA